MKITREPPLDGVALSAFTPDSIRPVRDFTARKTLEQAHTFVAGLVALAREAERDEGARDLVRKLASVGITEADAQQIAAEAVALIAMMAERDREAEVFHAAVREAGQGERAMYERLAALARVLRVRLGDRSPALAKLGVPPGEVEDGGPRTRRERRSQPPRDL
jgi:hypothetical protein